MLFPLTILPGLSWKSVYTVEKMEEVDTAEQQADQHCSDQSSDGIGADLLVSIEVVLEVS